MKITIELDLTNEDDRTDYVLLHRMRALQSALDAGLALIRNKTKYGNLTTTEAKHLEEIRTTMLDEMQAEEIL